MNSKASPPAPKRPLTSFNFFFKEERQKLLDEVIAKNEMERQAREIQEIQKEGRRRRHRRRGRPSTRETSLGIPFEDLVRMISKKWKSMAPDERVRFEEMAQEDKIRYMRQKEERNKEIECAEYQKSMLNKAAPSSTCSNVPGFLHPSHSYAVAVSKELSSANNKRSPSSTVAPVRHQDGKNIMPKTVAPDLCQSANGDPVATSGIAYPKLSTLKPDLPPLFTNSTEVCPPRTSNLPVFFPNSAVPNSALAMLGYNHTPHLQNSRVVNAAASSNSELTLASILGRGGGQFAAPPTLALQPSVIRSIHLASLFGQPPV